MCGSASDCPGGGTCRADGRCLLTLASGQFEPYAVVVDATRVYWTNLAIASTNGSIASAPLLGGVTMTLASAESGPAAIAVDSSSVYWADGSAIMSVPLDGGAKVTLASQQYPGGIALAHGSLFWTNLGDNTIRAIATNGGSVATLAGGYSGQQRASVVVDTSIYWTDAIHNLMEVGLGGGSPTTLASGQLAPQTIAIDTSTVYWINVDNGAFGGGSIVSLPRGGGTPTTLASGQDNPNFIAIDATSVYWTNYSVPMSTTGSVMKVAIAGGTPATLASAQYNPNGIVVDDTSVYWANGGGTVVRLTPK